MAGVTLQSPAILQRPVNSWNEGNSIELLRPIISDIQSINTNNAGEASLGSNTFTGVQTVTNTTDSTTKDTGSIITEGGVGVEKAIFAGGKITTSDTTASTTSTTGSLIAGGGAGIAGAIFAGTTINAGTTLSAGTGIILPDGTVGALAVRFGADANNGFYGVSDTQLGVAVEGTLVAGFNTTGLFTDSIVEQTSLSNITVGSAIIQKHATAAANATATLTAAQVKTGYITSTSAAATVLTLPTGTDLGAALGAARGTIHELYIDNTAGANTVTIAVSTNGILSDAATTTAASFGQLTVASGETGLARFTLMFSSATAFAFTRTA